MRNIICDTNIWYGLGNQTIIKPSASKLIATWINIIEIGFSHPEIKEKIDVDLCKKAATAILDFADEIIELDPFAYAASKILPDLILHPTPIKDILFDLSKNGLPDSSLYQEFKKYYDYFMSTKNRYAESINAEKAKIRSSELKNNISKEKFKKSDVDQINEHAVSLIQDINEYLKSEHNKQLVFIDQVDFNNMIASTKHLFNCYLLLKQVFIKKLILTKSMKMQPNDFYDLLNLIYIDKENSYWTKENRWKTAFHEAKMANYLFEE